MMYKFTLLFREDTTDYDRISLYTFTDSSRISKWAYNAMCWAVDNGMISGTSLDTLSPKSLTTRAQAAQIIYCSTNK